MKTKYTYNEVLSTTMLFGNDSKHNVIDNDHFRTTTEQPYGVSVAYAYIPSSVLSFLPKFDYNNQQICFRPTQSSPTRARFLLHCFT
jgi:hypothetical protein